MPESSDQKKASIPSWQRQSQPQERTEPELKPDEPPKEAPPPSRAALLEQASRFLQEDEIREASTDRKIAFLESKGLTNDEISSLLGVSRNTAASSSSSSSSSSPPAHESKTMESQENPPPPQPSSPPSHPPPPPSSPPQHQPQPQPPTTNPIPPIITYPEFLLHSHPPKPAPLLTPHRLLTTLYLSSALAASLYGLSKTVLAPMTSALTSARHDLAATALADLAKLNARLEGVVSELPPRLARLPEAAEGEGAEEESEDEDPTELFHRDVGTQTASSPPRSSADSDDSSNAPSTPREATPTTTKTTAHTTALRAIHAHLSELLTEDSSVAVADESVRDRIADLQAYLDGLAYASPSYGNGGAGGVYGMYGNGSGSGGAGGGWGWSSGKGGGGGEEDGIARVKAEIRGVKGVLLSARNFPGSTRGSGVGRVGGGDGAVIRNSTVT